jgi:hypothetical protein
MSLTAWGTLAGVLAFLGLVKGLCWGIERYPWAIAGVLGAVVALATILG